MNKGIKMEITFKRRLTNELLTTFLPSFFLLGICYATIHFKSFYFEAAVTVNLTVMLVATTLFIRSLNIFHVWNICPYLFQCDGQTSSHLLPEAGWHLADYNPTGPIPAGGPHYIHCNIWRWCGDQSSWICKVNICMILLLTIFNNSWQQTNKLMSLIL